MADARLEAKSSEESLPSPLAVKKFLELRWERIRGTILSYPYCSALKQSKICLALAEAVAAELNSDRYSLLMPSIKTKKNEITSTELKDPGLKLWQFILDDNEEKFIEVDSCLSIGKDHCKFSHQDQNEEQGLTRGEFSRLVNHSRAANDYYRAVKRVNDVKAKGFSIGAEVYKLHLRLMAGGVKRRGIADHKVDAGKESYEGVKEFYEFIKTLTRDEQHSLYEMKDSGLTVVRNFKILWYRLLSRAATAKREGVAWITIDEAEYNLILEELARPENTTSDNPCVQLYAGYILQILDNNKDIYNRYPQHKRAPSESAIGVLIEERERMGKTLVHQLESSNHGNRVTRHIRNHQGSGYRKNIEQLTTKIYDNPLTFSGFINRIKCFDTLIIFLHLIPDQPARIRFLQQLHRTSPDRSLKTYIGTWQQIKTVQNYLLKGDHPKLIEMLGLSNDAYLQLGADYLESLESTANASDFRVALDIYPGDESLLLNKLGPAYLIRRVMKDIQSLSIVLSSPSNKRHYLFIDSLDSDILKHIFPIQDIYAAIHQIEAVADKETRKKLYFALTKAYVQQRASLGDYTGWGGFFGHPMTRSRKVEKARELLGSMYHRNQSLSFTAPEFKEGRLGAIATAYTATMRRT